MGNTGLRASLIWHDEVMGDVVLEKPDTVTIGRGEGATFTAPVPAQAIVTPGRRGYLLTLSSAMSGVVCLGGVEHDVAAWVRAGEEPGGFRATPIGGNDWGVIALDASGDHKLFFQFVELEEAEWNLGHPMILAAVGGFALSAFALTALFWWKGVPVGEAAFRGGSLSSLAIGLAAVVRWVLRQDNESRASLAFSVMLHAAILFAGFQLLENSKGYEWPEQASHAGSYLVKAEDLPPPAPAPKQPTVTEKAKPGATLPVRRGWTRPTGAKVEKPSARIATALKPKQETGTAQVPGTRNEAPKIGVLVHEDVLHDVLGRDVTKAVQAIAKVGGGDGGPTAPAGAGGPGVTKGGGDGVGPVGQRKGTGDMDTGGLRSSVCAGAGCGGGGGEVSVLPPPKDPPPDGPPTITAKEIDRVIKAHRGMFVACYQKALDKNAALAGDVTLHFEISTAGRVTSSSQSGGSLRDGTAVACMTRALGILQFPAKGGALVNYPFVFTAQ